MELQFIFEVRSINCSAILKSVDGISFHERGDLPVFLFPSKTELISVVFNSPTVFKCPTRLDFDVEVNRSIQMWGILEDESIPPVTLFLVEGPILNPMLDGEIFI